MRKETIMTKQEYERWQAVTQSSQFRWTEDEIYRLNGRGAFYYHGGEDGIYMKIQNDGMLEAGNYEGAIPHIGEAFFEPVVQRQCKDFNEAYTTAMEAGGKQFLIDMLTQPDIIMPPEDTEPVQTHFYCPLTVQMEDDEGYDYVEVDTGILGYYEDKIRDAIEKDMQCGGDTDLAEYFHGIQSLQDKLLSVRFDVENVRNEIFGYIHVDTSEPLTDDEKEEIRDYCTGQASDGFGEGFEQRPVETDDGSLYISFWDSDDDWFMLDDDEFEQYLGSQQMGGYQ